MFKISRNHFYGKGEKNYETKIFVNYHGACYDADTTSCHRFCGA